MGFDFRKHVPKQFNKIRVPENYNWEVHNLNAYEELKKEVALGKKTLADLQEFEHKYKESAEQREWRWRREHVFLQRWRTNVYHFWSLGRWAEQLQFQLLARRSTRF